jgi:hypothetical protein
MKSAMRSVRPPAFAAVGANAVIERPGGPPVPSNDTLMSMASLPPRSPRSKSSGKSSAASVTPSRIKDC